MKRILTNLILLIALTIASPAFGQQLLEYAKFQGPKTGISAIVISPDGRTVVVAGKDKSVTLWDTNNGKRLTKLDCQEAIASLAISADGKLLATLETNKCVRLWNFPGGSDLAARGWDGKGEPRFVGGTGEIGPMVITADRKVLIAYEGGGHNGPNVNGSLVVTAAISLLDVGTGKSRLLISTSTPGGIPGISANLKPLAFSPDGKTLAVGTHEPGGRYDVIIVDTATGKQLAILKGVHRDAVVALSADGKTLAATALERIPVMYGPDGEVAASIPTHQIHFWDVPTAKLRSTGPALADIVVLQADGQSFVTVDANHAVSYWINHPGWRCRTPEVQAELMNKTARLKGMKDAVADIEKGTLKLKFMPRVRSGVEWQMPDYEGAYMALMTQECGVAWVTVESSGLAELSPEMVGYNAVMSLEIEHRFGPDIIRRLREKAHTQASKN